MKRTAVILSIALVLTLGLSLVANAAGGLVIVEGKLKVAPTVPKVGREFRLSGELIFPVGGLEPIEMLIVEIHGGEDWLTVVPALEHCKTRKSDIPGIDAIVECKLEKDIRLAMESPGTKTVDISYWMEGMEAPRPVTLPSGDLFQFTFEVRE